MTARELVAYLEAADRKRARLLVQYRQRGPILTDQDYDDLAGDLANWRRRWLARVAS